MKEFFLQAIKASLKTQHKVVIAETTYVTCPHCKGKKPKCKECNNQGVLTE